MNMVVFLVSFIACALFIGSLAVFFGNFKKKENHFRLKNRLVIPILMVYLSVAAFRFLFLLLDKTYADDLSGSISGMIVYALIHAFQTFSLDENYHMAYRAFVESLMPVLSLYSGILARLFLLIFLLENVMAPVMSGAFILDILSDIFPKLRLRLYMFLRKKRVYIFSCISEKTVTLAESIRKHFPGAVIVFTDVYLSRGDELQAERVERARLINAICLREDMSLIDTIGTEKTVYFLMDDQEVNMRTLAGITTAPRFLQNWKKAKEVELHFAFDGYDMDPLLEHSNSALEKAGLDNVLIVPLGESENTIYDLLKTCPLYSVVTRESQKLRIMVVGDSSLARRFFEISYWSGQMLNPYGEASEGSPSFLDAEIAFVCEGAYKIRKEYEDFCPDVLALRPDDMCGMRVHFIEYRQEGLPEILDGMEDRNYIFIDSGNDYHNIRIAERIKEYYDDKYVARENRLIINTVISDRKFMEIESGIFEDQKGYGRIHTFGCISDRYSYEAVMRTQERDETYAVNRSHDARKARQFYADLYSSRSSKASRIYFETRLFSAGISFKDRDPRDYLEEFDAYLSDEACVNLKSFEEKNRWNAYTRMSGYHAPRTGQALDFYEKYDHFEMHKVESGAKKLYHMHACLLDLKFTGQRPAAMMTDEEKTKMHDMLKGYIREEYLEAAKKERADLCLAYPMFSDYLKHLKERLSGECPGTDGIDLLDELDILSLLSGKDYKSYDHEQIRNLARYKLDLMND